MKRTGLVLAIILGFAPTMFAAEKPDPKIEALAQVIFRSVSEKDAELLLHSFTHKDSIDLRADIRIDDNRVTFGLWQGEYTYNVLHIDRNNFPSRDFAIIDSEYKGKPTLFYRPATTANRGNISAQFQAALVTEDDMFKATTLALEKYKEATAARDLNEVRKSGELRKRTNAIKHNISNIRPQLPFDGDSVSPLVKAVLPAGVDATIVRW